jgi:hypothetical protein
MDELKPKSHQEAVAVFRHGVLGAVTQAQLDKGALHEALMQLATQRFRPPGSETTKSFSFSTLERWYYAYRRAGLAGLAPRPRSDKGRALRVSDEARGGVDPVSLSPPRCERRDPTCRRQDRRRTPSSGRRFLRWSRRKGASPRTSRASSE